MASSGNEQYPRTLRHLGGPALPRSAVGRGSVVSEAVTVHNAARQHLAGITGRGVKVGVIDLGFIDLRKIRNDGELPPTIRARCYWRVGRFNNHGYTVIPYARTGASFRIHRWRPSSQRKLFGVNDQTLHSSHSANGNSPFSDARLART